MACIGTHHGRKCKSCFQAHLIVMACRHASAAGHCAGFSCRGCASAGKHGSHGYSAERRHPAHAAGAPHRCQARAAGRHAGEGPAFNIDSTPLLAEQ